MRSKLSRRDLLLAASAGATSIALAEMGVPAYADDGFAISIVGVHPGRLLRTVLAEPGKRSVNHLMIHRQGRGNFWVNVHPEILFLDFEGAAMLRDKIQAIKDLDLGIMPKRPEALKAEARAAAGLPTRPAGQKRRGRPNGRPGSQRR